MPRPAERLLQLGALALILAVPGRALAVDKGTSDRLRDLEAEITGLVDEVAALKVNFTERSGLIGVNEARERYEDAVYLYLVGDYEPAATSFYILVTSRALGNGELARDSEWYLAECLFELQNYATAEQAYGAILKVGASHPYMADSVRRLLEIHGLTGDVAAFDLLYNEWIASGRVPPTELVTYTLAQSFYRRGEAGRAKGAFGSLPPASPYYSRSRYYLGVLMILEKDYKQALREFDEAVKAPVTDDTQKAVNELAMMAMARVHYELGEFEQAGTWYGKIGKDSPHFADRLYEAVWTYVKQAAIEERKSTAARDLAEKEKVDTEARKRLDEASVFDAAARAAWGQALEQAGVFLLSFPENQYTVSLRLLQGHLHMKLESFDQARAAYEGVVQEYTPMIARLEGVAGQKAEMADLLASISGAAGARLPGYASEMLLSRDDVSRATSAWKEFERQDTDLVASERMVADLQLATSGGSDILGAFVDARSQLTQARGSVVTVQDRLLEVEANYLRTRVPASIKADLQTLQRDRAAGLALLAEAGQGASDDSDRISAYEAQVREVQQRAFRVGQVVQELRASAGAIADQLPQSKLNATEAEKVRLELAAQQEELARMSAEVERFQSDVVKRKIMQTIRPASSDDTAGARATVLTRHRELRTRLQSWRRYATDADAGAVFAQIDRVWAAAEKCDAATDDTRRVLETAESRELTSVQRAIAAEAARVQALRGEVDTGGENAETVAGGILVASLDELEQGFRDDVLEADKGIVDVYWLRKTQSADDLTRLAKEQSRLIRELQEQYRIVQENLER